MEDCRGHSSLEQKEDVAAVEIETVSEVKRNGHITYEPDGQTQTIEEPDGETQTMEEPDGVIQTTNDVINGKDINESSNEERSCVEESKVLSEVERGDDITTDSVNKETKAESKQTDHRNREDQEHQVHRELETQVSKDLVDGEDESVSQIRFVTLEYLMEVLCNEKTSELEAMQLLESSPDIVPFLYSIDKNDILQSLIQIAQSRNWESVSERCIWYDSLEIDLLLKIIRRIEIALLGYEELSVVDLLNDILSPEVATSLRTFPINKPIFEGNTLLHVAALHSLDKVIKYLLDCRANCNIRNKNGGDTPLIIAGRNCSMTVFMLMSSKADCNIQNDDGDTALHVVLKQTEPRQHQVSQLTATTLMRFNQSIKNKDGDTVLHLACKKPLPSILSKLLALPNSLESINIVNNDNRTLLDLLLYKCLQKDTTFLPHLKLLFQKPESCSWCPDESELNNIRNVLFEAIVDNNEPLFSTLVEHPRVLTSIEANGKLCLDSLIQKCLVQHNSPFFSSLKLILQRSKRLWLDHIKESQLLNALKNDNELMFSFFLESPQCKLEGNYYGNNTLLHIACSMKIVSYVYLRLIIRHPSCDPNQQNDNGDTAMHIACRTGKFDAMRLMFELKTLNLSLVNNAGITPLMEVFSWCRQRGDMNIPSQLVEIFPEFHNGDNILHAASRMEYGSSVAMDILKLTKEEAKLLKKYLLAKNNEGLNPIQVTLKNQHFDKADLLHSAHNPYGYSLLHLLCYPQPCLLKSLKVLLENPKYSYGLKQRDNKGNAPLHIACSQNFVEAVQCIIAQDPSTILNKNNAGETPLHVACSSRQFECVNILLQYEPSSVVSSPDDDGWLPLHWACQLGEEDLVKALLDKDPDPISSLACQNSDGDTPFHLVCKEHSRLLCFLLEKYSIKDLVNKQDRNGNTAFHLILKLHSNEEVMDALHGLLAAVRDVPMIRNKDENTIFHECIKDDYYDPLKLLLEKAKDQIKCEMIAELTLYAYTIEPPKIPKIFLLLDTHKSCHTNNSVCQPLSTQPYGLIHHAAERNDVKLCELLIKDFQIDPTTLTEDGNTPLHIACKNNSEPVARFLLSTGKCNTTVQNSIQETPLRLAAGSYSMLALLNKYQDLSQCKEQYPVDSYCKVFVTGHSGAGKSTVIKTFKNYASLRNVASKFMNRFLTVSDVEPFTAGIIPSTFFGKDVGNIVIYDLAGQFEYHSCHAAILENLISSSCPLYILVVDMSKNIPEVKGQLQYWLNFLQNECSHLRISSPVIIIGSHDDEARTNTSTYAEKRQLPTQILSENYPSLKMAGFVEMDCRRLASNGLENLHKIMSRECSILRLLAPKVSLLCHGLYAFLTTSITDPVLTLGEISKGLQEMEDTFLPTNPVDLAAHLTTLSDKGLILFLKNSDKIAESWVIIQKQYLLSEIHGQLFAPEHFKNHLGLHNSTGLVPMSEISRCFPQYSPEMIVAFLTHFELCQKFDNSIFSNINLVEEDPLESMLFFPGLIEDAPPENIWPPENTPRENHYWFGWVLQCTNEQFFTSRFLHVLLLRLAFCFALKIDELPDESVAPPMLKRRRCDIWKTGIRWLNKGTWTLVHLTNNNRTLQMVMAAPFNSQQNLRIVQYRTEIMAAILNIQNQFCKGLKLREVVLHPSIAYVPTNSDFALSSRSSTPYLFSLKDIARAIIETQDTTGYIDDTAGKHSITLSNLLLFESYKRINEQVLSTLFASENSEEPVKSSFILDLVKCLGIRSEFSPHELAVKFFGLDEFQVNSHLAVWDKESSLTQYCFAIGAWTELASNPTYASLHLCLDKFSIFSSRRPLVSSFNNATCYINNI